MYGMSTTVLIDKLVKGFQDLKWPADAITLKNAQALNEAITSIRDSIGLSDIGAIKAGDLKIKPLIIQGITPTAASYETGNYPIAKNLYILTPQISSVLANDFVDFILGWEGKKVIMDNGYLSP
jgi:phosphate transport system substrate-binding protein